MADRRRWCVVTVLDEAGGVCLRSAVGGPGMPDLAVVDRVARLVLLAKRSGSRVILTDVVPELQELLHLAGLGVEVEGEAE